VVCCGSTACDGVFTPAVAERDLSRYRRRGLRGSAAWLRDALRADGVDGTTLLEVGGGIGSIQVELLQAGALHATNVELVGSYEPAAERLIAERAVAGRVDRHVGDLVADPSLVRPAAIVIMHRVVCCSPDADGLMHAATEHAGERIALTFPRRSWWVRLGFTGMNAWLRLRRVAFRGYVHRPARLLELGEQAGFRPVRQHRGMLWSSVVLRREH
jgi:hypothetical protein